MLEAFNEFVAYTEEHQPGQWAGYVSFTRNVPDFGDVLNVMSLMFIGEQEDAQPALDILRKMTSTNPDIKVYKEEQENYDSWLKWHGVNETDSVGASAFLSSRLLQSENFATAEARTELAKAIYAANFGQYHLVAGKGV